MASGVSQLAYRSNVACSTGKAREALRLGDAELADSRSRGSWGLLAVLTLGLALVGSSAVAHVGEGPAVYRVNAGGGLVTGTPNWSADSSGSPSPYVNSAATLVFSTNTAIDTTHASIPPGTPTSLFQTERYDPPGGSEMQWDFPVTPGTYEVRLYFAEIYSGAQSVGARVFDVTIEGALVLNDYDIFAEVGIYKGVMKPFVVTADANLDIDFGHVVENPKVSAIEILPVGSTPGTLGGSPTSLGFGSVVVGQSRVLALQLTNLGAVGDPAIVIDRTLISGPDASLFSDNFPDASDITLAPGQSTTVNVNFAPTATGSQSAILEVYHSGTNTPLQVSLSGEGLPVSVPGAWESRAPSGPVRQEVAYVQLNGKFYLAGGGSAHEVYDPTTNSWADVASLPESLDHIQAVTVDGKIYYVGGLESWPSPASAQVYIYDPGTNSFTQGAPMPRPRGAGGVAVYQGRIYYAGGLSAGSAVPWFDVYDPGINSWSALPDMPVARDHFHAAVVGTKFFVTGGRDTSIDATITSTIAYDLDAGTWQTGGLQPIPTARGGFGAAVLGDEILVIGGEGGGSTFANVEAYNTTTNTWRSLAPMPTARHGIQATECNGGVYVAAGGLTQGGSNPSDIHQVFFLNGTTTCVPPPPPAVAIHRVNAGGGLVTGTPDWSADSSGSPSPYVNAAETVVSSTVSAIDSTHASIPPGTPASLFQTERYDPAGGSEMQWDFPVTPGTYEVRLYFAEIYSGAQSVGSRVLDVTIEGALVLNDYDIFAEVGGYKGVMKSFVVTADANLEIDFGHVVENPKVSAIEILPVGTPGTLGGSPTSLGFGSVVVGQSRVLALQLTNLGAVGDSAIVIDQTLISGPDASLFSDNFPDASDITLAPGQSTTVNVSFAPTATGSQSAILEVYHSGTNTPLQVPLSGTGAVATPIGFGKSVLQGVAGLNSPTSLQFGPDGRLYVGRQDGLIHAYTVVRNAANSYTATATETISLIKSIPNHNDDGTLNAGVTTRLITGILVVGTLQNPVIYVAHSDPRIGGGTSGSDLNLDTNSSMISRLTWTGASWQKLDLVRGLPRSEENHAANGMQLDPVQNVLYVAMGGNTNKGAPSNNFAFLPEFALSAAVLAINLSAIGNTTYDLPTLDDQNRTGNPDANDPFGGNDGKNQAKLVPGDPVQVYAPGFRNPYDLSITQSGKLYTIDNGGNAGWGDVPVAEGVQGNCTNDPNEPGTTDPDSLHLITGPGYYGGHPNPTRGNMANKFNTSNPQSPVSIANPIECDFRTPGAGNGALATFPASTNGLTEYTTANFGGALQGDLITAAFNNTIYRIDLNADGTQAVAVTALFSAVGSTPLDVQALGVGAPFPGTIWVGDYGAHSIIVFEPNDFGGGGPSCTGADDPALDEDSDGYDNADEIDNGTSPCSSADVPPDWDGDLNSNLNDPDDDNDGTPDTSDAFAIDPSNGLTKALPVVYTWENDAPSPGGILNLGFTGLMTNGAADYESLYDASKMTAGGAAGVTTVDEASDGDALGGLNSQMYGFQFGVNLNPTANDDFTVHTRIMGPFNGLIPQDFQSMGLFIGTGDQDNYVKVVTSANGGAGGIEFIKEVGGSSTSRPVAPVTLPGPNYVDLYLSVDPDAATVQPRYSVTIGGVTGPVTDLGGPEPVPSGWFTNPTSGLAIGILSTSRGTAPAFPATWDFIEVTADPPPPPASALAYDTFTRSVTDAWGTADLGGSWTILAGSVVNFDVDGSRGTVFTPNQQQVAHLGNVAVRDVDLSASMTFPNLPSGGDVFYGYLLLRRQSSGAYYRVGLYVTSDGGVFFRGQTDSGAALFSDLNTSLSLAPGDTVSLRVQAEGASPTTLRVRAWKAGTVEPATWAISATSTVSALQTAGSVGIRTISVGNASTSITFDGFLATALGPPATSQAHDTFTRSVTDGWGTADLGGSWSILGGTAANFDVDGTRGIVFTPNGNKEQVAHLGGISARDVDLRVSMSFQSLPSGGGVFYSYLLLRRQTGGAYFRVGLYVTSSGGVFFRGQTDSGASLFSDQDTGLSMAPGDTVSLRVQVEGVSPTTLRARGWKAGTVEPATWAISATSTVSALQTAGSVGIRTISVGNASTSIAFDDLTVEALP